MPETYSEWFSVVAAAAFVGVSVFTIRQLADRGLLPCTRDINGWRWFNLHDLQALKAARAAAGLKSGRKRHVAPKMDDKGAGNGRD